MNRDTPLVRTYRLADCDSLSRKTSQICLRSLLWATWSTPSITDIEFDVDEVYKVLCGIDPSKACGPDEIPGRLLREGAPWLAEPITKLFSMSLQSGSLPRDWRRANVAPVFKTGNKHSSSNYRPVGELP